MSYGKILARRSALCLFIVCFFFLACCLRLYSIATGDYAQSQTAQSSLKVQIIRPRGTVYDRNMFPLNNQSTRIMAAVSPTPRAVVALSTALAKDERLPDLLDRLSAGKPIVCEVPEVIDCDGIVCTEVAVAHSANQPAEHIVGYTDSNAHGVTGLEAAYDDILYSTDIIEAVFKTDGTGRVMEGEEIEITGEAAAVGNGIVTTLDINIQSKAERAALGIDRGALVVCNAQTGEILACVSRPSFDCTRVSDYLNRKDSPLLNRALSAYSVGSVFKPCVAAAGVELGKTDYLYQCNGSIEIADRAFRCHKNDGHGAVSLSDALAFSCNVYFYRFAINIGAEKIYNTARALGFGSALSVCKGISTAAGSIDSLEYLQNNAALANLGIGQGGLAVSPVSMLNLYCAIANNGTYRIPSLVSATVKGGRLTENQLPSPTRVISEQTAALLRENLKGVISNGTGITAKPTACAAAGKTATAQTGTYTQDGTEITNGWFCGFFPADNPQYVAVIMEEDATGSDVAPVFAELVDIIIGGS